MPKRIEPPMDRDPRTHQGRWQEQVCDIFNKQRHGGTTDYVQIEDDGTIRMVGAATVWKDKNFSGSSLGSAASAPDLVTLAGNILAPGFDGNAITEQLYNDDELPHEWKEGTDIIFHLHWSPSTASAGTVKWNLEYTWQNLDGTASSTDTVSVTVNATGDKKHQKARFPALSGAGKTFGSHVAFRLYRDPSEDTYPDDAILRSIGYHYEADTIGSRQETAK